MSKFHRPHARVGGEGGIWERRKWEKLKRKEKIDAIRREMGERRWERVPSMSAPS